MFLLQILVAGGGGEVLGIAFEERHRCKFGLLDVQILRLRKLEQRTQIISAGGVNDDDALALFEFAARALPMLQRSKRK